MRKTKKELEVIKKKYNVDELWSWSKYNTYKTDPYGYFLKYIKRVPETKTSIYGVSGGNCHDIIESFYNKQIKFKDMLPIYEDKLFEMNMAELKYNRKDEKANKNMAEKYENNIRLFFQQHIPIKGKVITEQFITINIQNNIFQGYIDFVYKDKDGNYIIIDWKTSTIYTGKKVLKESGQLVLYAESLIQRGVSLDKIKIGWNFLKYCTVNYTLASKDKETKEYKLKNKHSLRTEWVKSISSNLKTWLKKTCEYDELIIDEMIDIAVDNNNLENLPKEIQDKYSIEDCYVYIPLTQEIIDDLKADIIKTINEININKKSFEATKNDKIWWTEIDKTNEFFFANLCGYSIKQHKPYKEYLDDLNMFAKDKEENDEEDDSWMNELD